MGAGQVLARAIASGISQGTELLLYRGEGKTPFDPSLDRPGAPVYPRRYGYAGVLSGYFVPSNDRLGNPLRIVDPFQGSTELRRMNTPLDRVPALSLAIKIPQFWLGTGSSNHRDVNAAQRFQQVILTRQPNVVLDIEPGGTHTMATWRALVPPLLEWMTPNLAQAALHPQPPQVAGHAKSPAKTRVHTAISAHTTAP